MSLDRIMWPNMKMMESELEILGAHIDDTFPKLMWSSLEVFNHATHAIVKT